MPQKMQSLSLCFGHDRPDNGDWLGPDEARTVAAWAGDAFMLWLVPVPSSLLAALLRSGARRWH